MEETDSPRVCLQNGKLLNGQRIFVRPARQSSRVEYCLWLLFCRSHIAAFLLLTLLKGPVQQVWPPNSCFFLICLVCGGERIADWRTFPGRVVPRQAHSRVDSRYLLRVSEGEVSFTWTSEVETGATQNPDRSCSHEEVNADRRITLDRVDLVKDPSGRAGKHKELPGGPCKVKWVMEGRSHTQQLTTRRFAVDVPNPGRVMPAT